MPLVASPIDFAACRRALIAAIGLATGLPNGRVIREEAQGPDQVPPSLPYAAFMFRLAGMRSGFRDNIRPAPQISDTAYYVAGHRGLAIDVTFFGREQEEAYGMAAAFAAALEAEPVREALGAANLAVWAVGDVTDVSTLLGTGFEARALVEFQAWLNSRMVVDLGRIETVPVEGVLAADDGAENAFALTATLDPEG